MGMLQRCPSRRDAVRCEGCGVQPVCRHWEAAREQPNTRRGGSRHGNAMQQAKGVRS
jgi:hypothetical protein